jgi:hypothetical protein
MAEPLPKQNPLKEMMHVFPLASSESVLIEVVEFSTPEEYNSKDPLHLCEGERSSSSSSSSSIEFEPLPAGQYDVALDLDRESTSSFHDVSLDMEKSLAMEIYEALTLEYKGKDCINEHGSFILDTPHEPCLHHTSLESTMLSALRTHEDCNNIMVLSYKKFRSMVVDAYVYHKH